MLVSACIGDEWQDSQDHSSQEPESDELGAGEGDEGDESGDYALSRDTTAEIWPTSGASTLEDDGRPPSRTPPPGAKRQRQASLDRFVVGDGGPGLYVGGGPVYVLVEMGFGATAARAALERCGHDHEKAIEFLLAAQHHHQE